MSSPRLARLRASLFGSAAVFAVLLSVPAADAATLRAVGNAQASVFQRVQIQPQEFTDVDNQLIDPITSALAARGIQVDPNATMVLSFDTEISNLTEAPGGGGVNDTELGAPGDDEDLFPDNPVSPVEGEYPTTFTDETVVFKLGGAAPPQPAAIRSYSLDFVLSGDGGVPIWQGSIRARLPEQDPVGVARSMVLPLVASMGQTVSPTRVQLQVPPFE